MQAITYDTPGELHVELRLPSGHVIVRAQDSTTSILEITGERDPDDIKITFDDDGTKHRLVVEQRKKSLFGRVTQQELEVRLTVPQGAHISLSGGSTDLTTEGSIGSLSFNSASGDATVEDVIGNASAKVASGDLRVGTVAGSLTFHSASGDIRAAEVGGKLVARTASGDVEMYQTNGEVNVTTVSGDVKVGNLVSGTLSLQAVSGDIEVSVAPGTRVFLDLSSLSGSTKSELPVSDASIPDSPQGGGTAEASVKAATVSGDIRVQHSVA